MTTEDVAKMLAGVCERSADAMLDALEKPVFGQPSATIHDRAVCRSVLVAGLAEKPADALLDSLEAPIEGVSSITVNSRENCLGLLVAGMAEMVVESISLAVRRGS